MISLKKLLEQSPQETKVEEETRFARGSVKVAERESTTVPAKPFFGARMEESPALLPAALIAYRSALQEMGSCTLDACPALGSDLKHKLQEVEEGIHPRVSPETLAAAELTVRDQLRDWGKRTARHYRDKVSEVKEILLVLARTAESVGDRDQRAAQQIGDVTSRLIKVADLEDFSLIRKAIESSAAELKTSIERMTAEGKAAIAQLRAEVSNYQVKLEEAELIASSDSLTGLRNRLYLETQMERRMETVLPFCVAIIDINGFKQVNDEHGHLVGDELLKQFSNELKCICRATDMIGRWGGDEFIILLDCGLTDAAAQMERLRRHVVRLYTAQGRSGSIKLTVSASIGLAERAPRESLKDLVSRADTAMYAEKAASKGLATEGKRSI